MKPHRLFGLCVLCLSLAAPVAAADVSTKAPKVTVDGSAAVTTDLSKDQWDDWDEGFDDEWVDRRDRDGDRDRDRFDDDDFYNGVDDRQGRDRDDVYDDYGDNWDDRYGRDDDDRYYRDRDRYDNDRDSRLRVCRNGDCNYDRDDDYYDRDSRVRVCRNGVCTYEEERDDYYYDRRSGDRNFEYRLEDNTSDDALPFILQILQQL